MSDSSPSLSQHSITDSRISRWLGEVLPGLAVAILIAHVATSSSDFLGTAVLRFARSPLSPVLVAIILGLIVSNTITLPSALKPGLDFAVKKVLRLGIILLGIRLSLLDVVQLGLVGIPIVIVCILGGIVIALVLSRWLKLSPRLGMLIAVGTAICGVSAIVAASPTVEAKKEEVSYAVAVITLFGIVATLLYPFLASVVFGTDAVQAGLFLGTAIHDTSQVTGAALIFSNQYNLPLALDTATVTKLVRNVFIVAVIPMVAAYSAHNGMTSQSNTPNKNNLLHLVPLFVLGFLGMALVRSIGDLWLTSGGHAYGVFDSASWKALYTWIQDAALFLLTVALAGVGLTTSFRVLSGLGVKPMLVGLTAALAVGGISIFVIKLLQ
jgi:uncharacterized integral membrane protein (TIGR00698 family)